MLKKATTAILNNEIKRALFDVIVFSPVHIVKGSYREHNHTIEFAIKDGKSTVTEYTIYKSDIRKQLEIVVDSIIFNSGKEIKETLTKKDKTTTI